MTNVAIAGGSGGLGKTLAEVLASNPKNKVFVLSRRAVTQEPSDGWANVHVNYDDVESLQKTFETNEVDTVISCLGSYGGESSGRAEMNLVRAAHASTSTKRFISNNWGIPVPEDKLSAVPGASYRNAAVEEVKKTGLQWTLFFNGYLMDYFGTPRLKSHMPGPPPFVNVASKVAAIPGSGNEPVTLTYSYDVAKFVDALLDARDWPQHSYVIGDRVTWNEFVAMAEDARGTKFHVTYDSVERLERGHVTDIPGFDNFDRYGSKEQRAKFFAMIGLSMVAGDWDLPSENSLNAKFPDIKPLSVGEMLDQAWRGS